MAELLIEKWVRDFETFKKNLKTGMADKLTREKVLADELLKLRNAALMTRDKFLLQLRGDKEKHAELQQKNAQQKIYGHTEAEQLCRIADLLDGFLKREELMNMDDAAFIKTFKDAVAAEDFNLWQLCRSLYKQKLKIANQTRFEKVMEEAFTSGVTQAERNLISDIEAREAEVKGLDEFLRKLAGDEQPAAPVSTPEVLCDAAQNVVNFDTIVNDRINFLLQEMTMR